MIDVTYLVDQYGPDYGKVKDALMREFCAHYTSLLLARYKSKRQAARHAKTDRSAWRRLEIRGSLVRSVDTNEKTPS